MINANAQVDARILAGYSLPEALYVWQTRRTKPWSPAQISLADRSLTRAITEFGFPDRAAVEAYLYPYLLAGPLPQPVG